jgi:hypothetical protein
LAGTVLALGCSQGDDRPATYQVTGTVTWNNGPVAGANVSFAPAVQGEGRAAVGETDSSGKYTLSTFGGDDGAVPGAYNVTITKFEGGAEAGGSDDSGGSEDEAYDAAYDAAGGKMEAEAPQAKNLLPAKYADAKTSGLTKTVEAKDNVFDFVLEGE